MKNYFLKLALLCQLINLKMNKLKKKMIGDLNNLT